MYIKFLYNLALLFEEQMSRCPRIKLHRTLTVVMVLTCKINCGLSTKASTRNFLDAKKTKNMRTQCLLEVIGSHCSKSLLSAIFVA